MPLENLSCLRNALLSWYRRNKRDLPWRRTKDPYKIWVSEIMLQQTQVAAVIPYYKRWLARFPTVESLAQAREQEVMKYWAGLGYYRRARMLHEAARQLEQGSENFINNPPSSSPHGVRRGSAYIDSRLKTCGNDEKKMAHSLIPKSAPELLKLPGIGRYTAAAVASIAYGEPVAVLDGNVKRILSRIFAIKTPIDTPKGEKKLWKIAENLVVCSSNFNYLSSSPHALRRGSSYSDSRLKPCGNDEEKYHPGDLNQAMMELGATVCFPANPDCVKCPVRSECKAFQSGSVEKFPVISRREKSEKITTAALILRQNGKVLIKRQSREGRWGGLWMFPHWKNKKEMIREINAGARHASPLRHRMTITHGFTKYRVKLEVYESNSNPAQSGREYLEGAGRPLFQWKCSGAALAGFAGMREKGPDKQGAPPQPGIYTRGERSRKILPAALRWVKTSELHKYPFPAPHQKIVKELVNQNGS